MASPSMDSAAAAKLLSNVALQSFGSKAREAEKGGFGSIGMIGNKVVKFNTHWQESLRKATPEMIQSSNQLRESLGAAAKALYQDDGKRTGSLKDEVLKNIYDKLGLDADGNLIKTKSLLSRTVAASVLTMIDKFRHGGNSSLMGAARYNNLRTSSKGTDTRANFTAELKNFTSNALMGLQLVVADEDKKLAYARTISHAMSDSGRTVDMMDEDGRLSHELLDYCVQSGEEKIAKANALKQNWIELQNINESKSGTKNKSEECLKMHKLISGLPNAHRVDGLALALSVGPKKLMEDISLMCVSQNKTFDDLVTVFSNLVTKLQGMKPKQGYVDANLFKEYKQELISGFSNAKKLEDVNAQAKENPQSFDAELKRVAEQVKKTNAEQAKKNGAQDKPSWLSW